MPNFSDQATDESLMLAAELAGSDTVTLQRQTAGADAEGGVTRSFADVADYSAQVQTVSATVVMDYAQRGLDVTHNVLFFEDVQASVTDLILWGSRVLKVVGYRDASAGMLVLYIADCLEDIPSV